MADRPQVFDFDPEFRTARCAFTITNQNPWATSPDARLYSARLRPESARQISVLFLLHGGFDTEATWTEYGRAHFILDNLLAMKKARPMIIVMLDGFATQRAPVANLDDRDGSRTAFEYDLLNEVIPFVETNYRIRPGRENRGITGLSMGGGQSLTIGLTHLEQLAWVGGMSASVAKRELVLGGVINDPKAVNRQLSFCGSPAPNPTEQCGRMRKWIRLSPSMASGTHLSRWKADTNGPCGGAAWRSFYLWYLRTESKSFSSAQPHSLGISQVSGADDYFL